MVAERDQPMTQLTTTVPLWRTASSMNSDVRVKKRDMFAFGWSSTWKLKEETFLQMISQKHLQTITTYP